jgi:VWFA-related protein
MPAGGARWYIPSRVWVMRIFILLLCTGASLAQLPSGRSPSRLARRGAGTTAELEAVVVDAAGHIAPGLTEADFSLESAKPAKLESCQYVDTRTHRTLVFLVDDLGLTDDAIDEVRAALENFVRTAMQPADQAAILRSGSGEGALQQLTADHEILGRAIARLYYNPRRGYYTAGAARANAWNTGAMGTLRAAIAGLSRLPGHKSVVLFSSGLQTLPVVEQESLITSARRAEVSVYGIDPSAPAAAPVEQTARSQTATPLPFTNFALTDIAMNGMAGIAKSTGGDLLGAGSALPRVLRRITAGPDGYYRITYQERAVETQPPQLKVLRPGVELLSARTASEDSGQLLMISADAQGYDQAGILSDPFATGQIRTRVTPFFYYSAAGSRECVYIHVDAHDLSFRRALDGAYHGGVGVLVAAFGSTGQALAQREERLDVAWSPSQYEEGLRTGVVVAVYLPVSSGMLQLRAAVSDETSGKAGSASRWVEVPAVGDGRLAISGLELTGSKESLVFDSTAQIPPGPDAAAPVFHAGQPIYYRCDLYNLNIDAAKASRVELQFVFFREGQMVVANQPMEVALQGRQDARSSQLTGQITLPATLNPGFYQMRLGIKDKLASGGAPRMAAQFAEFELRK